MYTIYVVYMRNGEKCNTRSVFTRLGNGCVAFHRKTMFHVLDGNGSTRCNNIIVAGHVGMTPGIEIIVSSEGNMNEVGYFNSIL
jgi:hypothetical protein